MIDVLCTSLYVDCVNPACVIKENKVLLCKVVAAALKQKLSSQRGTC